MHILLIAYEFPPSPSPQSLRWAYLARHLTDLGHRLTVLTIHLGGESAGLPALPPQISLHRTFAGPVRGSLAALRDRRLKFSQATGSLPSNSSTPLTPIAVQSRKGWKQALSDTIQTMAANVLFPDVRGEWFPWARRRLELILKADKPDIVISSHEPATSLELGLLAKEQGIPWIADLGDPVLATYTPSRWRKRAGALEREVARSADHILVTTAAAATLLSQRHGRDERVTVITQGHDSDSLHHATPGMFQADRLELLYTGSFYSFRRPEALLDAIREIPEVRLNIASVSLPASIVERAREMPGQVRILGFLPHVQALGLQRQADILVNIGNADASQVPGKIYEYLGACRPILHLRDSDDAISQLLSEIQRGWSCENQPAPIAALLRGRLAAKKENRLDAEVDLRIGPVQPWHWKTGATRIAEIARDLSRSD
jgi:glycosyltransferase involved in cell wall biosynthesis